MQGLQPENTTYNPSKEKKKHKENNLSLTNIDF